MDVIRPVQISHRTYIELPGKHPRVMPTVLSARATHFIIPLSPSVSALDSDASAALRSDSSGKRRSKAARVLSVEMHTFTRLDP